MSDRYDLEDATADASLCDAIADSVAPWPLDSSVKGRLFERISNSLEGPEGTMTLRRDEGQWHHFLDKVRIKVLRTDPQAGNQTVLLKLEPGAVLPRHAHDQEEECLVLSGRVCFGDFCLGPGDFHLAKAGMRHEQMSAPDGALLMLRQELRSPHAHAP